MNKFSRRRFLKQSFTGAVGLTVLPMIKGYRPGANDTIRFGFIGLGRHARTLVNRFHQVPGVKIVAGCDVYGIKRLRFERMVTAYQQEHQLHVEVDTCEDYERILDRSDIDVVVIATPDHWHGLQAIDACRAGKDIYLEKPLTFTIKEGIHLVKAVRENNIILGVGSQQRSSPNFHHAVNLARNGKLGEITKVNAWVGPPPVPYDLPEEQIPEDLNWDKWLGPNPYIHYNHRLNPPISLDPPQNEEFWGGWRWYKEIGGGYMTDFGAHNFDIAQWALKKEHSGPVEIVPAGYNGHEHITFTYDDGITMINAPFTEDETFGVKIWGKDAWFEVTRGHVAASDPSLLPEEDDEDGEVTARPHNVNFVEAVRARKDPIAPVEDGHRSASVGTLGNIASFLNRPLRWDPHNERFVNDPESNQYLHREYRSGYQLM